MAHPTYNLPALNLDEANTVQKVLRTFLYYSLAVNPTILATLNIIADQKSKSTQGTAKQLVQLPNYAVMQTEEITIYHAIVITLHMHSNTSFLLAPGAKIRAGGCHYLSEP